MSRGAAFSEATTGSEFYHIEIIDRAFGDGEAHHRAHMVKPMFSCGTWVEHEHTLIGRVSCDLEDMGVATDEDIWRVIL